MLTVVTIQPRAIVARLGTNYKNDERKIASI